MIRLFVTTAGLSSFRPTGSSFSCVRRLFKQTYFTSRVSASDSSTALTRSNWNSSNLSRFKGNSGSVATKSSPPPLLCLVRRTLNVGFVPYDFSRKESLGHDHPPAESGAPDFLTSVHSCDAVKVPLANGSSRSFRGWLGGTIAAAILLIAAFLFANHNENPRALDDFNLASASSEVQKLATDLCTRVTAAYDTFCTSFLTFLAKVDEAATAVAVLARCVYAVLFTRGEDYAQELGLRWKLRVTSLLADLAASSHSRRRALIQAGNGSVVDWLLEAVGQKEQKYRLVQAEAARALSHFLSDDVTNEVVLGRPNALSHLLFFAASIQPNLSAKKSKRQKLDLFLGNDEWLRGRSMLVAALMDIITSSCEIEKKGGIRPKLSGVANVSDISAALKVLQDCSFCLDEAHDENIDDNGGKGEDFTGVQEIGLDVSNETGTVGVPNQSVSSSRTVWTLLSGWGGKWLTYSKEWQVNLRPDLIEAGLKGSEKFAATNQETVSHGLWDDLHGNHVAVPLAAWAIATWAQASSANCGKIAKLDKDGSAILACVMASERTVKWHGAVAARLILENGFGEHVAVAWSGALLEGAKQASMVEDAQLSLIALDSFYSCIRKSGQAKETAAKHSLTMLRDIAKQTIQIVNLQKMIAEILELLCIRGVGLSSEEGKKWSSILLRWLLNCSLDDSTRRIASKILAHVLDELGPSGIPLSQAWLAMVIMGTVNGYTNDPAQEDAMVSKSSKPKGLVQVRSSQLAVQAANELAKAVLLSIGEVQVSAHEKGTLDVSESEWGELNKLGLFSVVGKLSKKDKGKLTAANPAENTLKAMKALTELSSDDKGCQLRLIEMGGLQLLRRFILKDDFAEISGLERTLRLDEHSANVEKDPVSKGPAAARLRKHATRMLSFLSLQPSAATSIEEDEAWCSWLEACADNKLSSCNDLKTCSYARATLWNLKVCKNCSGQKTSVNQSKGLEKEQPTPHYEDKVFIINTESPFWRHSKNGQEGAANKVLNATESNLTCWENANDTFSDFKMDVVFVHGLFGGPFKTWRISDDKTSSTDRAGLVEKIDVDSGREGTCWPKEWLSRDIPTCRVLTVKYKTNLSQWSGATLPLQEVSAMLLQKLVAAGVGDRPVVFITHSMGGLVVKQMLMQAAQDNKFSPLVKSTAGIVFYSCPHFGSKLADVPWRLGLVLRPAPSIGELRSGSSRLEELNQFIRTLHKGGLDILSFSETKVTPLVEGYGGWALRMEVVPIESAYPGFGELVVLDGTDHVNSCKPLSRDDIAYTQTLKLLKKITRSAEAGHQ